ncbi:MAG: C40 family peptidase [Cyanobacteria bacterium P01_H01_bin.121]
MVSQQEYRVLQNLNLYDSSACDRLATQAAAERHVQFLEPEVTASTITQPVQIQVCEDDYIAWLNPVDTPLLTPAATHYQAPVWSEAAIAAQVEHVIQFAQVAMAQPNTYLWGGTVAPHYDCSGLMQTAFQSVGIWLPRDAYQQEAFTTQLSITADDYSALQRGDLVFFGSPTQATHVGLYLGAGRYLHSSGQAIGRNTIGIDSLAPSDEPTSQRYLQQLRQGGRVVRSLQRGELATLFP